MDATTAPHHIPVEMPKYGERHHIFELMQIMLQELLIHQPEEPIQFMLNHLQRDNDRVPRIFILGPPASGKTTIAMWLCKHLNISLITKQNLIWNEFSILAARAAVIYASELAIPDSLLMKLLKERLEKEECISKGWILDGIPETREQALMIQTSGISPRHVIVLSAPDTVLIERNLGKRIDSYNGEVYHTTFDWPSDPEIQNRLKAPLGISEQETAKRLIEYHRHMPRILPSYPKILKVISSDQPCVDVFYQALTYVQSQHRSNAPFTPKILLCGPIGSGKSLQAALLAQKYGIINVCCGHLLKEAVASNTNVGELIRPFFEKEMQVYESLLLGLLSVAESTIAITSEAKTAKNNPQSDRQKQTFHEDSLAGYQEGSIKVYWEQSPAMHEPGVLAPGQPRPALAGGTLGEWITNSCGGFQSYQPINAKEKARDQWTLWKQKNSSLVTLERQMSVNYMLRVFFLNVPYDSVIERLTLRRTDPATGERYHLMYKPPPTMEIQGRLMQHPKDTEEKVKLKMDSFYRNSSLLEEYFENVIYVNGDQDPYTVFEYIESGIIMPLPTKVP
ncbi:adenylate kinase 8 [Petaurus breviceps papuanus]|uniref:adenylate kinase 8 n=1 Tax=Petaurus breviceps papuanus TaxID=3040969 RepID=UPI0036DBD799